MADSIEQAITSDAIVKLYLDDKQKKKLVFGVFFISKYHVGGEISMFVLISSMCILCFSCYNIENRVFDRL